MKIWLTGTHGSGKSTILRMLPIKWKITEVSRTLIEHLGFNPLVGESTYEQKLDFEKKILSVQIKHELELDDFVTDRTIFDVLAYSSTLLNTLDYWDMVALVSEYYHWQNPYDIVVYIPIEFPMVSDGVRPEGERYREQIDKAILSVLKSFKIPYVTAKGTPEERVSQIYREIERVQALRKGVPTV